MRTMTKIGSALALGLLAACAAPMQVPEGFSRLRDGDGFVARAADDGVLRSRKVADPTEGSDAAFWLQALRTDFVGQRGYVETGSGEIADADGVTGHWIECTANVRGEKVGYLVAVWVVEPTLPWGAPFLCVAEFAAVDAVFQARVEAVKAALATVKG